MLVGEGHHEQANWAPTTIGHAQGDMGGYHHGFHHQTSKGERGLDHRHRGGPYEQVLPLRKLALKVLRNC